MTACLDFRDGKYSDVVKRGSYIVLNKDKDKLDKVIAFARHRHGRTLLVIANKNVNRNVIMQDRCSNLKS